MKTETMTDLQITTLARLAFHASKSATGDDGAAFEAANEVIKARATGPGFFNAETLTWSTREAQGTTVDNITQAEIRALRREAKEAGDLRMADLCGMALDDGAPDVIAKIVAAIRENEAQS